MDGQANRKTNRKTEQTPWERLGNKFTLGLRTRSESEWLPFEDAFGDAGRRRDQMTERAWLFDNRHGETFAALDGSEDAGAEVRDMVMAHLADYHGSTPDLPAAAMHPLEAAARLVPEDLLLLKSRPRDADDGLLDWTLAAAALAFPAHWVLAEKMGRPLAGIHEPVPHYGERLETPLDRFFTNMQVGPISHRWNWSVVTSPELFTPDRALSAPIAVGEGIQRLFVRMESQTLRKLPETGQILFTIRTYIEPVLKWAHIPGALADLATMLAGMSPQIRAYKGVSRYEDALQHHLASLQS